jgi:hypothetical protein
MFHQAITTGQREVFIENQSPAKKGIAERWDVFSKFKTVF